MRNLESAQAVNENGEMPARFDASFTKPMVDMSNPNDVRSTFARSESRDPSFGSNQGELMFSNPYGDDCRWSNHDSSRGGPDDHAGGGRGGGSADRGTGSDNSSSVGARGESDDHGARDHDDRGSHGQGDGYRRGRDDHRGGNHHDHGGKLDHGTGSHHDHGGELDHGTGSDTSTNDRNRGGNHEHGGGKHSDCGGTDGAGEQPPQITTTPGDTTPPTSTTPVETTPPTSTTPVETTPPTSTTPVETTPPTSTTPVESAPPSTTAQPTDPTTGTTGDAGFTIQNGQLLMNGKLLTGVAVSSQYEMQEGPTAVAQQVATDFPGVNVVRLLTSPAGGAFSQDVSVPNPETVSDIEQAIAAFNAKGIGVIVGNHSGDSQNLDNVSTDGSEPAWFAQIAKAEMGNNMVMFQTQNEPEGDPSTINTSATNSANIEAEQQAVYNAIRATGSNAIVAFDLQGGYNAAPQEAYASTYDKDSNYVIDAHNYAGSTASNDIAPFTAGEVAQTANLREADGGKVPVYIGETGNSMDGYSVDPQTMLQLTTDLTDGTGVVFFGMDASSFGNYKGAGDNPDVMLSSAGGPLDAYGQQIAALVKQGAS